MEDNTKRKLDNTLECAKEVSVGVAKLGSIALRMMICVGTGGKITLHSARSMEKTWESAMENFGNAFDIWR